MQYLLDTQILIWFLEDNPKLNERLRSVIENPANSLIVSQFSLIEISIKLNLGKLPAFIIGMDEFVNQLLLDGVNVLSIDNKHIFAYQTLPFLENHRDPFDRFLLATALSEQMPILSADEKFLLYRPIINVVD